MTAPSRVPAQAWVVVLLLWPVALLNYLDRQMLATVRTSLMDDVPDIATGERFGYLLAAFMWVYALLSPVGGFLGDRFDRRRAVVASLFVWSATTFATGFARTFDELLLLRGLMGVSEALYIPTALALITDFHPGATRARAVGLHQTGIYCGQALGGLGGYIAAFGSWRNAFFGFGAVGMAYALVLLKFLPDRPRSSDLESEERTPARLGEAVRARRATGLLGSRGLLHLARHRRLGHEELAADAPGRRVLPARRPRRHVGHGEHDVRERGRGRVRRVAGGLLVGTYEPRPGVRQPRSAPR